MPLFRSKHIILMAILLLLFTQITQIAQSKTPNPASSTKTLRSIARIYIALGKYQKAEPLTQQALDIATLQNPGSVELSRCLCDAAYLNYSMGRFSKARRQYTQSLEIQQEILGTEDRNLAYTMRSLAAVHMQLQQYTQADQLIEHSIHIMLKHHEPEDAAIGPFLADYAKVLTARNKLEQAEAAYRKAHKIIENSFGAEHLYTANFKVDLADFYILQKNHDQAETLIAQAIKTLHRTAQFDSPHIAKALQIRSKIHQAKNSYDHSSILAMNTSKTITMQ